MTSETEPDEERERFEHWLAHMDDALAAFLAALPGAEREALDFGIASLDALEAMLLARYPDPTHLRNEGASAFVDGCARYVGETLRRNLGGTWKIDLDDATSIHHRKPTVANFSNHMPPVCPIQWVFTATRRRKGTFMTGVVANYGLGD